MNLRSFTTSLAACLVAASVASAQGMGGSTSGGPSTGTGTGGGGATPGTTTGSAAPTNLDLPMDEPAYVGEPTPPVQDPPADDPRDEPPPTIYGEEIDTTNNTIFYVIDISCSMDWDNQSYTTLDGRRANGPRIDRAKAELQRSISGLPQNFKFNIVAFSCSTRTWQRQMQEATDANKQSAMGWVRGLQPTDATGTGPGTCLALADRNNMTVVLLTDGAPNCGTYEQTEASHRNMIRNGNSQHATINVFGIAAYGSYRAFCQNVASDSGGSYYDVP